MQQVTPLKFTLPEYSGFSLNNSRNLCSPWPQQAISESAPFPIPQWTGKAPHTTNKSLAVILMVISSSPPGLGGFSSHSPQNKPESAFPCSAPLCSSEKLLRHRLFLSFLPYNSHWPLLTGSYSFLDPHTWRSWSWDPSYHLEVKKKKRDRQIYPIDCIHLFT